MLEPGGSIDFVSELTDAVDGFLRTYEEKHGGLDSDLERALIMAYVLGVMRCDLRAIQTALGEASVFGPLDPFAIFEQCTGDSDGQLEERHEAVKGTLRQRGWID